MDRSLLNTQDDNTLMGLYKALFRHYGPQYWWPARTVEEMMIGAILVQNTAWTNVEKSLRNFESFDGKYILSLDQETLIDMIRSSGFYKGKSQAIQTLFEWYKTYNCDIKNVQSQTSSMIRKELLSLKGIGNETADCIMVYAVNKAYFIIDAYTKRILGRLGYDVDMTYMKLQAFIESHLDDDIEVYKEFHALLVEHGKSYCKKTPDCTNCFLNNKCQYFKDKKNS